ncbi:hypothetical protein O3S80_03755 [Streptomyces sp. Lzd4kr]|nr:hypothetical protein [Streptomyces sp. Lzd4kr]
MVVPHRRARQPVEPEPGVLIHPAADRRLAVEHWLLSTLPAAGRERARIEWREQGLALLPLGGLFSAVRLPAALVLAAGHLDTAGAEADAMLTEVLDGPVICDPRGRRYYALVPPSVPRTWRQAADEWRSADVDVLGRDTLLGVPRVDLDADSAQPGASYWAAPMESAGVLCRPLAVARFIAAALHTLGETREGF